MHTFGYSYLTIYNNSSTAANKGLFNSSGHYSNIISKRFNSVGLGSYIDSDGSKHWVQLFGQ